MKRFLTILMLCLSYAGAQAETLKGIVIDQNAQPISGASITCKYFQGSDSLFISTESNNEGYWKLDYDVTWGELTITATSEGYTSYTCFIEPRLGQGSLPLFTFRLFNAVDYHAGKRSTIYLPIAPKTSWGKYFRLYQEEGNKIIFKREHNPKAYVPYVFFPYQDLHIDLAGMDLSGETCYNRTEHVSFYGSFNVHSGYDVPISLITRSLDEQLPYVPYNGEDYMDPVPMHANISWMYGAFEDENSMPIEPEIVYYDTEYTSYRPFVDNDKVWYVGWFPGASNPAMRLDRYYFEGDTIINNRECKQMWRHYEYSKEWTNSSDNTQATEYVGALYEDNRRVYCTFPGKQQAELLYDFASPVGDSIDVHGGSCLIIEKDACQTEIFKGNYTCFDLKLAFDGLPSTEYKEFDYQHLNYWYEGVGLYGAPPLDNVLGDAPGYYCTLLTCTTGDEVIYKASHLKLADDLEEKNNVYEIHASFEVKRQRIDFTHTVKTRPKSPRQINKKTESQENMLTGEYSLIDLNLNFLPLDGVYTVTIRNESTGETVYCKDVQTKNTLALNTPLTNFASGTYSLNVENDFELYSALLNVQDIVGIREVAEDAHSTKYTNHNGAEPVYDLSGRQIMSRKKNALPKGIYIQGGRKFVK